MREIGEIDTNQSFISLRVILITVLLGFGVTLYLESALREEAFFLILIATLVYLFISFQFLFYPFFQNYVKWFKAIQIGVDIAIASSVIYITGGKSSPFVFLYALVIIFANIILSRTAGYIAAVVSGVLYVLIVLYQYHLEFSMSSSEFLVSQLVRGENELGFGYTHFNLAGFLLIAMLSGYLSERINITRKELGESRKSLSLLENLHRNILQSLTSGVITTDTRGRIISVNKTALEILGITQEGEVLWNEINHLIGDLRVEEFIYKRRAELVYSTPRGNKITLGFSSSVLRNPEGEAQGFIVVFQDLTEVKALEERFRISQNMALLGQLAAGLAHEIRNPLSTISGAVEILSAEVEPSEENMRLLKIAGDHVQRLNLIVEDFLLLTRPIEKPQISVDVSLIISETVESFLNATRIRGLEVVVDTERGLYVEADPQELKQVIWNLLLNAMQAMPNGGKITVGANVDVENVIIKISDEGCGIKKSLIPKIFEPFFTTREVGTGLGLTIVQKVIEGYNGEVDVLSSENKGTTFVIKLPETKSSKEETLYLHKTKVHDKL
ncbi:MAG TPA: ATP-binding protein [Thermodesulfobacteriota bacterium]|nr:ATP-binding protein [Thermodesulfobacteriota bacterium]